MFERVRAAIARQMDMEAGAIGRDTALMADLRINSLDLVELVCELEMELGVNVPEKDLRKFSTVGDVADYLEAKG